jgi:transporter family protein
MVWTTIGYVILLPFLFTGSHLTTLPPMAIAVGLLAGFANGLGAWFLLIALNKGATASVAVPFTALYPLLTIVLAITFLGERLTRTQALGISLALTAAVLLSYEKEVPKAI